MCRAGAEPAAVTERWTGAQYDMAKFPEDGTDMPEFNPRDSGTKSSFGSRQKEMQVITLKAGLVSRQT